MSKETNWKQKSQKNQNENICLICLDAESLCKREQSQACLGYAECSQGSPRGNERNFHLLSFGKIPVRGDIGMKNQRWDLLVMCLKIWYLLKNPVF